MNKIGLKTGIIIHILLILISYFIILLLGSIYGIFSFLLFILLCFPIYFYRIGIDKNHNNFIRIGIIIGLIIGTIISFTSVLTFNYIESLYIRDSLYWFYNLIENQNILMFLMLERTENQFFIRKVELIVWSVVWVSEIISGTLLLLKIK